MSGYDSEISGFYKLSLEKRQKLIAKLVKIEPDELKVLQNLGYFSSEELDSLVENVIGSYQLPLGIACNFKINKKDYLIPIVTEEPSVIAAASNAAKIARAHGGFISYPVKSIMIGQIQITDIPNELDAIEKLMDNKEEMLKIANEQDPTLVQLGGGAIDVLIRDLATIKGKMIILHLLVNVLDAMGANIINTMAEAVAPYAEELTGGKVYLRIVSNLAMYRIAKCRATFDRELLGGDEIIKGIMSAYQFALADPYRAATHNKGIMNGIVGLALATGNDTRAIEAGAHVYASLQGIYSPLTDFYINKEGNLVGGIEIPIVLGTIGGITRSHPMSKIALKILNVESAEELSQVAAAVGLAQNVAALKALVSEGIQKSHMKLHARKFDKK